MVYYPWYSGTPSGFSPLFENLFVACKGTVDITSSKPGEYSFVNGKQPTRGSFFTWAFTDLFKDDKANEAMYWQEFVEKLGPKVEETFKETFPDIAKDIADKNLGTNVRGGRPTGQTVHVNNYPGMSKSNATSTAGSASTSTSGSSTSGSTSAPAGTGPRFGLRAVNHDGDGVRITAITAGAPASKMPRIAIGDIITEINGETIKNESDYDRAVDNSGRTMKVKIRKADSTTTWDLSVDLAW